MSATQATSRVQHWHGIFRKHFNAVDGAVFITQFLSH